MNYVRDVASQFVSRCQNIHILGPADFVTIAEWEKQGIPLSLVLAAIDVAFESADADKITSALDIQSDVREAFATWLGRPI